MKPQPSSDPWQPFKQHLLAVLASLAETQAASDNASSSPEQAEQLTASCAQLAQLLGQTPPPPASPTPPPGDVRLLIDQFAANLDSLRQSVARLGGASERALGVLFPTEQVNAYARLGGRTPYAGGSRGGGHTAYKA